MGTLNPTHSLTHSLNKWADKTKTETKTSGFTSFHFFHSYTANIGCATAEN